MCGDKALKTISYAVMTNAFTGNFGVPGQCTINYFAVYEAGSGIISGLKPNFSCAHRSETYLAAMWSLLENELKAKRRTLLGIANCPVDIQIKDKSGTVIGEIKNNSVIKNNDNLALQVKGDSKTFAMPMNDNFTISITGNDTGTMDYSLCEIDPDTGETGRIFYKGVPVSDGKTMKQTIRAGQELQDIELKDSSGVNIEKRYINTSSLGNLSVKVTVEGNGDASSLSNLTPGDYVTVGAFPKAGNSFDGWYDKNGNFITNEPEYSFSITQNVKLKAKFSKTGKNSNKTEPISTSTKPASSTANTPATQPAVQVGSVYSVNSNKYLVTSADTVAFVTPASKKIKAISIPSEVVINGNAYTVTEIYPKAFAGCKKLKAVSIPATIQKIGAKAFYKCKKLKKVYVKTSLLTKATVGKAAFKKIYKKAKFYVPSANKKYYKKLFRKRGAPKKIKVKGF